VTRVRKLLIGLLAAAILAVAGFFGFEFYVQHRIESEIEAAFEPIRAAGGKASHGKVSFDLRNRTIRVADMTGETAATPALRFKIAGLTASGVGQSDAAGRFAETIEISDVELGLQADWSLAYKAPRVVIKDYKAPAGHSPSLAGSTAADVYRSALLQFAAITASSLTAPSQSIEIGLPAGSGAQSYSYNYSNVTLNDIKQGQVARITADRAEFTASIRQNGKTEKLGGELAGLALDDFDSAPVAAMFDPARPDDDKYLRVYRRINVGAYTVSLPEGVRMRMDGHTIDDVGLRPSRLQLPQLMAMIASPPPGSTPNPALAREMMGKAASIYEGVHVGNAEMRGLAIESPAGPLKLGTIRFNLDNGKIGELALEGLEAGSPQAPVKLARFAIRSFDVTGLLRLASQFLTPGQPPSSDQLLAMLPLLEGAEIKGLVAPFKTTNKQVKVDTISLDWGQFVGPIPTKAHLIAKLTTPIDATDPAQEQLVAAGLTTAAIDVDLGAAWTEASGAFVLDPVKFDFGEVLEASAHVSLAHVPRGLFSPDLPQATAMASQIEAGTLELTLRDTGGVDLAVAQYALAQTISRDAARRALVDSIKTSAQANTDNADVLAAAEAIARFIETPRGTLTLKLTPLGTVPALQLVQLMKTDPMTALAQFRIEASSGL
jgi:hypothetical protein